MENLNQQPPTNYVQPQLPEKKSKTKKILIIIGIFIVVAMISKGLIMFKGLKDGEIISEKITNFMQLVSSHNIYDAYEMTSMSFKKMNSLGDFETFTEDFEFLFSDFEQQEQTGFYYETGTGGTFYQYTGRTIYTNGHTGSLTTTFVKDNGEYKIERFDAEVNLTADELKNIDL